jgi:5-formyltetrahydrofolate cyclo-ligase
MESKDQLRKQLRTQRNERLACADFAASDIPASDIPARNFPASPSATGHSEAGRSEASESEVRESSSSNISPPKDSAASNTDLAIIQQLDALLPELLKKRPGSIASFWPLAGEPDLRPLASKGLPLALPRTEPSGLCFLPWHADTVLEPDSCGIPSPRRQRRVRRRRQRIRQRLGVGPRALSNGLNSAIFFAFFSALRTGLAARKAAAEVEAQARAPARAGRARRAAA